MNKEFIRNFKVHLYIHNQILWLRVRIEFFPLLSPKPLPFKYIDLPIFKDKSRHLSKARSKER